MLEQENLKELAIKILDEAYSCPVLFSGFKEQKKDIIRKTLIFEDWRDKGYYCSWCRKFSSTPSTDPNTIVENDLLFQINGVFRGNFSIYDSIEKVLIVHSHYDGCAGWK